MILLINSIKYYFERTGSDKTLRAHGQIVWDSNKKLSNTNHYLQDMHPLKMYKHYLNIKDALLYASKKR